MGFILLIMNSRNNSWSGLGLLPGPQFPICTDLIRTPRTPIGPPQPKHHTPDLSPEIDLSTGRPMGVQGWLLLTLSLLVVTELIVLAALGPGQLLCQEDDSIVVDAQESCSTHSWGEAKSYRRPLMPLGSPPNPQHPCAPHLPLKERCLSRACPRASCTFSIRALHAPEEREGPGQSGWYCMGPPPSRSPPLLTHPPSSLPPR